MGILIASLAALVPLNEIVKLVNIGTLFAFFLVNVGVIILRRTHPDMERPFRVPFVPVFPIIGMLPDHLPGDQAAGRDVDPVRGSGSPSASPSTSSTAAPLAPADRAAGGEGEQP